MNKAAPYFPQLIYIPVLLCIVRHHISTLASYLGISPS